MAANTLPQSGRNGMTIINQLKAAIAAYQGPLTGDSIEAVWFRQAARQLLALEQ